jgi:hypothetical protein
MTDSPLWAALVTSLPVKEDPQGEAVLCHFHLTPFGPEGTGCAERAK